MAVHWSVCSIGCKQDKLEEIIPRVAAMGYEGIEVWEGHIRDCLLSSVYSELDPDYEVYHLGLEWAEAIKAAGLCGPVVAGYFHFLDEKTHKANPILRNYNMNKAFKLAKLVSLFGGNKIRVMMDACASADASDDDWGLFVGCLKEMAQTVAPLGATLVLETHQNQLMDTTPSTLKLLARVNEPNVKLNLDIHNLFAMGEDPVQALETLWPHVVHVHMKNVTPEGKPALLWEGTMDYAPFLKALRKKDYEGFASLEWFGEDFYGAAEKTIAWLKAQEA